MWPWRPKKRDRIGAVLHELQRRIENSTEKGRPSRGTKLITLEPKELKRIEPWQNKEER